MIKYRNFYMNRFQCKYKMFVIVKVSRTERERNYNFVSFYINSFQFYYTFDKIRE